MDRLVADIFKSYSKECNRVIKELISMMGLNIRSRKVEQIQRKTKDSDCKFVHFNQPHFNGSSDVYFIYHSKSGTAKGFTVRMIFNKDNAQVVTKYYDSKKELDDHYSSLLIDGYIMKVK